MIVPPSPVPPLFDSWGSDGTQSGTYDDAHPWAGMSRVGFGQTLLGTLTSTVYTFPDSAIGKHFIVISGWTGSGEESGKVNINCPRLSTTAVANSLMLTSTYVDVTTAIGPNGTNVQPVLYSDQTWSVSMKEVFVVSSGSTITIDTPKNLGGTSLWSANRDNFLKIFEIDVLAV